MVIIVAQTTEEIKEAFVWLTESKKEYSNSEHSRLTKSQLFVKRREELQINHTILSESGWSSITYVNKIPDISGVYFFFGHNEEIIYIGSAQDLSVRVKQSYTERNRDNDVISIAWVTTSCTERARELEAVMINKYKPCLNKVIPNAKNPIEDSLDAYTLAKNKVVKLEF